MSFQVKTVDSIVASMINNLAAITDEITDFNKGSKIRSLFEAVAIELDTYYQALLSGLHDTIPVAIYRSFNFARLQPTAATGVVTFTRVTGGTGDIAIPAGTRVQVPGSEIVFQVSEATTLASGSTTVDADVTAISTGTAGNAAAGSITEIVDAVAGVASVTNAAAFVTGTDLETDIERKTRFRAWIASLGRATKAAVQYGAELAKLYDANGDVTEQVVEALVHEPCIDESPAGDAGVIDVYLWNGVDGASAELIAEAENILVGYTDDDGTVVAGYKGAGVICNVDAVNLDTENVTCTVWEADGYTYSSVEDDVEDAIAAYFATLGIGDTLVRSKLLAAIADVEGVEDVTLTAPAANVTATSAFYIITPGTVTITQGV